jgi:hypothetical protein
MDTILIGIALLIIVIIAFVYLKLSRQMNSEIIKMNKKIDSLTTNNIEKTKTPPISKLNIENSIEPQQPIVFPKNTGAKYNNIKEQYDTYVQNNNFDNIYEEDLSENIRNEIDNFTNNELIEEVPTGEEPLNFYNEKPLVNDEVNSDELNVEALNGEELNGEELNVEALNSDELNGEALNGEALNSDELNGEELNVEELNSDELNGEELNVEELNVDELNSDELNGEALNVDELNSDELNGEALNGDELNSEALNGEELNGEDDELNGEELNGEDDELNGEELNGEDEVINKEINYTDYTLDEINNLTVKELQEIARKNKLKIRGKKDELIYRVKTLYNLNKLMK